MPLSLRNLRCFLKKIYMTMINACIWIIWLDYLNVFLQSSILVILDLARSRKAKILCKKNLTQKTTKYSCIFSGKTVFKTGFGDAISQCNFYNCVALFWRWFYFHTCSPFLTAWRPRQLFASQNVDMNMVNGLTAFNPIVDHQAVAFIKPTLLSNLASYQKAVT